MKFQVFARRGLRGRRYYWRAVADNGEPIAQSEGYVNRVDAIDAVRLIKREARLATVLVLVA